MILILTNSKDETANFFENKIIENSIAYYRFNTDEVIKNSKITFKFKSGNSPVILNNFDFDKDKITSVWYRRPNSINELVNDIEPDYRNFVAAEHRKVWNSFFEEFNNCKWVNHPSDNLRASLKPLQLKLANEIGLTIPYSIITNEPKQAYEFTNREDLSFIIKPLSNGLISASEGRDQIIYTNRIKKLNPDQFESISNCPTLIQEEILNKKDIRINYFEGKMCSFIIEYTHGDVDCRRNNMNNAKYIPFEIDFETTRKLCKLMTKLNLKFGTIDMAYTEDRGLVFFEVNPNGQWAWIEQAINYPISNMLCEILNVKKN